MKGENLGTFTNVHERSSSQVMNDQYFTLFFIFTLLFSKIRLLEKITPEFMIINRISRIYPRGGTLV
jgi:hypothetical protein